MKKKTIMMGMLISVVLISLSLLVSERLARESSVKSVVESIYNTTYDDYPDHWAIYRQKRIDLEGYYTKKAYESFKFDHFITDPMTSFYHFKADTKMEKITFNFNEHLSYKKVTCSFTAYIDVDYVDPDETSDQLELVGEVTLMKEEGQWKINFIDIRMLNYMDLIYKK